MSQLTPSQIKKIDQLVRESALEMQMAWIAAVDDVMDNITATIYGKIDPGTVSWVSEPPTLDNSRVQVFNYEDDAIIPEFPSFEYLREMLKGITEALLKQYDPSISSLTSVHFSDEIIVGLKLLEYQKDPAEKLVELWKQCAVDIIRSRITAKPFGMIGDDNP
jgi:hypothetical protein